MEQMTNDELQQVARGLLSDFFSTYPLYRTLQIDDSFAYLGDVNISYNAFCERDKEETTFTIEPRRLTSIQKEIVEGAMYVAKNITNSYSFALQ